MSEQTRRGFLRRSGAGAAAFGTVGLGGCTAPAADRDTAYVLSYFRTDAEAMHLAISDHGREWRALNDNRPVLTGEVRTRTMRDPFLFRDREGTYHALSTDGWESRYVVHATSENLLDWSEQEAIPVMTDVDGARNSWAPECFYDREEGVYRLIWSSTVGGEDEPEHWNHRIWSCATEDFESFTDPAVFFDPGYTVIDATVAYRGGTYYMVFKDERGFNDLDTEYKALRTATADRGRGPFESVSELISPSPVEGPAVFRHEGDWMLLYDHFLEGHWGASRSADWENWEAITDRVSFPPGSRHGSVVEVEAEVAERLREEL